MTAKKKKKTAAVVYHAAYRLDTVVSSGVCLCASDSKACTSKSTVKKTVPFVCHDQINV